MSFGGREKIPAAVSGGMAPVGGGRCVILLQVVLQLLSHPLLLRRRERRQMESARCIDIHSQVRPTAPARISSSLKR